MPDQTTQTGIVDQSLGDEPQVIGEAVAVPGELGTAAVATVKVTITLGDLQTLEKSSFEEMGFRSQGELKLLRIGTSDWVPIPAELILLWTVTSIAAEIPKHGPGPTPASGDPTPQYKIRIIPDPPGQEFETGPMYIYGTIGSTGYPPVGHH